MVVDLAASAATVAEGTSRASVLVFNCNNFLFKILRFFIIHDLCFQLIVTCDVSAVAVAKCTRTWAFPAS